MEIYFRCLRLNKILPIVWLVIFLLPAFAQAETSIWRISKNSQQLFLGGSVHLLSQADYPLPDEYEQVFREINMLVLEADLDALTKPAFQSQIRQRLLYTDGSTLKSKINSKTYKALVNYCKKIGFNTTTMQIMKPPLVVITLTMLKLQKAAMANAGVDQFFLKKAKIQGKKIAGLETAESQIDALAAMGMGQENELILSTIKDLKKAPEFVHDIKKAWRLGDLAGLEQNGINAMQNEFPELNQNLLTQRNNAWIPQIKALLATPEREFVLVGALHLAGKDGLIAQLKKQGYRVEQY